MSLPATTLRYRYRSRHRSGGSGTSRDGVIAAVGGDPIVATSVRDSRRPRK